MRIKKRSLALLLAALLALPVLPTKASEPSTAVEMGKNETAMGETGEVTAGGDEDNATEEPETDSMPDMNDERNQEAADIAGLDSEESSDTARPDSEESSDTAGLDSEESSDPAGSDSGESSDAAEPDSEESDMDGSEEGTEAEGNDSQAADEEKNPDEPGQKEPDKDVSGVDESSGEETEAEEANPEEPGGGEGDSDVPESGEPDQDMLEDGEVNSDAAEGDEATVDETVSDGESLTTMVGTIVDGGTLETGLSWELDDEGTLTISGTGDMPYCGYSMFPWYEKREQIAKVVIDSGVTGISSLAFYRYKALKTVNLGSGLKKIGLAAFSGSGLTAVEIPDSVETIENKAFAECASLALVTIGSGLSDLRGDSFAMCGALKDITLNGNANYVVRDGVIFTSDGTTLVECLAGNERTSYVVPDSVTTIGYAAFCDNYSLKEVGLPQGLKEIGGWAFGGTRLYDISIPAQTEKIGDGAFVNVCQEVFLYSQNAQIGERVFGSYWGDLPVRIYGYEGSSAQKYVEKNDSNNLKFIPISRSEAGQGLPIGVRYVPYEVSLRNMTGYLQEASYTLAGGSLPGGMSMGVDGLIKGTPTDVGRFAFTVQCHNGDSAELADYFLEIRDNTDVNLGVITDRGYELTEIVPDMNLSDLASGGSYTLCSRGDYAEFREVYLDGILLEKETDYTSEPGSTRSTIMAQTLEERGAGTHTIGIEFRTSEGRQRTAAQNYTATDTGNPGNPGGTPGNPGDDLGNPGGNPGNPGGNPGNPGDNPESGDNPEAGSSQEGAVTETSDDGADVPWVITYVVQRGDTLWKIAARFYGSGLLWHKIYQDNATSIRNPNQLHVGQVLRIYPDSGDMGMNRQGITYTVQAGDSLWKIAARFYGHGSMWERIYMANRNWITNLNLIFAKQILVIPQ